MSNAMSYAWGTVAAMLLVALIVTVIVSTHTVSSSISHEEVRAQILMSDDLYDQIESGKLVISSTKTPRFSRTTEYFDVFGIVNDFEVISSANAVPLRDDELALCPSGLRFTRTKDDWTFTIPWMKSDNYSVSETEACLIKSLKALRAAYLKMASNDTLGQPISGKSLAEQREESWEQKDQDRS